MLQTAISVARMLQPRKCRFRSWLIALTAVACVFLVVGPELALACPTCKEGLADGDPIRAGMVRGYFMSILFLMSMPFLILAGLASYFYAEILRARRRALASE